jgi:hypothetical protein
MSHQLVGGVNEEGCSNLQGKSKEEEGGRRERDISSQVRREGDEQFSAISISISICVT